MTREELIEVMARAIDPVSATNMAGYAKFKGFDTREVEEMKRKSAAWSLAKSKATAAITAIEAQGLAIVPVEATDEVNCSIDLGDSHWMVYGAYRAMIQAGRI